MNVVGVPVDLGGEPHLASLGELQPVGQEVAQHVHEQFGIGDEPLDRGRFLDDERNVRVRG